MTFYLVAFVLVVFLGSQLFPAFRFAEFSELTGIDAFEIEFTTFCRATLAFHFENSVNLKCINKMSLN